MPYLDPAAGKRREATGAAKLLDLHPNTLRSRLKKLGITRAGHEAS